MELNDLPSDLTEYIFQFLPVADVASCAVVCHAWSDATNSNLLWEKLYRRDFMILSEDQIPVSQEWCIIYQQSHHRLKLDPNYRSSFLTRLEDERSFTFSDDLYTAKHCASSYITTVRSVPLKSSGIVTMAIRITGNVREDAQIGLTHGGFEASALDPGSEFCIYDCGEKHSGYNSGDVLVIIMKWITPGESFLVRFFNCTTNTPVRESPKFVKRTRAVAGLTVYLVACSRAALSVIELLPVTRDMTARALEAEPFDEHELV